MRNFSLEIVFILMIAAINVKSQRIDCTEANYHRNQGTEIVHNLGCNFGSTSSLRSSDIAIDIPTNDLIAVLFLSGNKNVLYLPVRVHQSFPNLKEISAFECSIKEISKKNFDYLTQLEDLDLHHNFIAKIKSDTFDGLSKLRRIDLTSNKIKQLNGKAFDSLHSIRTIWLRLNECIDDYSTKGAASTQGKPAGRELEELKAIVTEKCGYEERYTENLLGLDCGIVKYESGLIVGATTASVRGQWPFIVALFLSRTHEFFCAGNLISNKHVLTAAHCIQQKSSRVKFEASDIYVLLGRHNLKLTSEEGFKIRIIQKVFIHPDWKFHTVRYDADLAILTLNTIVEFNQFIQPVCLPYDSEIDKFEIGTVTGWGTTEKNVINLEGLKQVQVRSLNNSYCFLEDREVSIFASLRSFCVGGQGIGPCKGDSGGGYFIEFRDSWTLRGIVSSAVLKGSGECNLNNFVLMTNVLNFTDWIKETVERNSG